MKSWKLISLALGSLMVSLSALAAEAVPQSSPPAALPSEPFSIIHFYLKGGPAMHFILACSVFALAVILERAINLRKSKIISTAFIEEIKKYWYRREIDKAIQACREYDISLSRVLRAGLLRFNHGIDAVEKAIEGAGQHEAAVLRRNLTILGFIANIAPMLGLFGTVLGLTRSFEVIAGYGMAGNPGAVAAGIAEALITTVFGLMVGIPTLAAYYYFRRKVEIRTLEMEAVSVALIEDLAYESAGPQAVANEYAMREGTIPSRLREPVR
ncbi:MAG TPA: MotA/TolQ/ExbB proton channel family protein [Terriglobales bacterium]|nr:MotA/TolQ/ExbB proton channel family protein [Terriglobales bacterium]